MPRGAEFGRIDPTGTVAERRVETAGNRRQTLAAHLRQQRQHGSGIDLQSPAHGHGQRPREGGVGQIVVTISLEGFQLALWNLDGRGQCGDVQALALARGAQQRTCACAAAGRARGLSH